MTMKTSLTIHDNPNLEKQMGGCMSSFFNLFEFSTNKRSYSKRLPPPVVNMPPDDTELPKKQQKKEHSLVEQDKNKTSVTGSPWKFNKETPRLSLDSRAITDSKGGLRPREIRVNNSESNFRDDEERSSPSLIARLMGLEPFLLEPVKKVELRRSPSQSRSRDRDWRFSDNSSFLPPVARTAQIKLENNNNNNNNNSAKDKKNNTKTNNNNNNIRRLTTECFPQRVTIYGEIERRLRIKGIDKQSKDLETLKHILEALQLKGLLHSNVVLKDSPILLVKSVKTNSAINRSRNLNNSSGEVSRSPRRDRLTRSPVRVDNRSLNPNVRQKCSAVESPVQSPRNRSPRSNRKPAVTVSADDDVSSVSSRSGYDSWRMEEYRDGRNLLKRCDKLLNSIAEIMASSSTSSSELQQPSPVSVLDSSFYRKVESSPSPVKKRTIIDFKEREDESWSPSSSSTRLLKLDNDIDFSDYSEFGYVSEIIRIRASNYFPYDDDLFLLLEKQSCITRDNSKASIFRRKLIFDTIIEILNRSRRVPPWKAASNPKPRSILDQTWSEFQKTQELAPKTQEPAPSKDDLLEVVRRVLQKDMSRDSNTDWADFPTEMSSAVLDIERLVFKDLIGEIIRDLATYGRKNVGVEAFRRKLVF